MSCNASDLRSRKLYLSQALKHVVLNALALLFSPRALPSFCRIYLSHPCCPRRRLSRSTTQHLFVSARHTDLKIRAAFRHVRAKRGDSREVTVNRRSRVWHRERSRWMILHYEGDDRYTRKYTSPSLAEYSRDLKKLLLRPRRPRRKYR